jgi:hypothetical protein
MKRFQQFVAESPNETEGLISVGKFFPLAPSLSIQPLIPDIKNAVASGALKTRVMSLSLKTLIPTQRSVSMPKVKTSADRWVNSTLPLVLLDRGKNILLDGHHRACAAVFLDKTQDTFATITASQLADWQAGEERQ